MHLLADCLRLEKVRSRDEWACCNRLVVSQRDGDWFAIDNTYKYISRFFLKPYVELWETLERKTRGMEDKAIGCSCDEGSRTHVLCNFCIIAAWRFLVSAFDYLMPRDTCMSWPTLYLWRCRVSWISSFILDSLDLPGYVTSGMPDPLFKKLGSHLRLHCHGHGSQSCQARWVESSACHESSYSSGPFLSIQQWWGSFLSSTASREFRLWCWIADLVRMVYVSVTLNMGP